MKLEQGTILGVHFEGRKNYLDFIQTAFVNCLVMGVQVKGLSFETEDYILFLTIAAPGIDRIHKLIKEHDGEIVS